MVVKRVDPFQCIGKRMKRALRHLVSSLPIHCSLLRMRSTPSLPPDLLVSCHLHSSSASSPSLWPSPQAPAMASRHLPFSLVKMGPLDLGEARELILLRWREARCGAASGAEEEVIAAATASTGWHRRLRRCHQVLLRRQRVPRLRCSDRPPLLHRASLPQQAPPPPQQDATSTATTGSVIF